MIKVIGRDNCVLCSHVKEHLEDLNIPFMALDIDEMNSLDKFKYIGYAKKARQIALPIIIENETFVTTKEFMDRLKGDK